MESLVFLIVLILLTYVDNASEISTTQEVSPKIGSKEWCVDIRTTFDIVPGKSFGKLPFSMHEAYLQAKCYRYFCKPHPMAGKGVFDCVPLDD